MTTFDAFRRFVTFGQIGARKVVDTPVTSPADGSRKRYGDYILSLDEKEFGDFTGITRISDNLSKDELKMSDAIRDRAKDFFFQDKYYDVWSSDLMNIMNRLGVSRAQFVTTYTSSNPTGAHYSALKTQFPDFPWPAETKEEDLTSNPMILRTGPVQPDIVETEGYRTTLMHADAISTMKAYTGLSDESVSNLYQLLSNEMRDLISLNDLSAFEAVGMSDGHDILEVNEKLLSAEDITPGNATVALGNLITRKGIDSGSRAVEGINSLTPGLKRLLGYAIMADERRVNLVNWSRFATMNDNDKKVVIFSLAMPVNAIGGKLDFNASAGLSITELTGLNNAEAAFEAANIKVGVHEMTKAELQKRARLMLASMKGFVTTADLINFAFHIYMNGNHNQIPDNWPVGRYTHGTLKALQKGGSAFGKNTLGRVLSGFLHHIHVNQNIWKSRINGFRNRLEISVENADLAEDANYRFLVSNGVNYFNGQFEAGKDKRIGPAMNHVIAAITDRRGGNDGARAEGQPGAPRRGRRATNV